MDPTPCASARVEDIAKTDANAIAFSFMIGVSSAPILSQHGPAFQSRWGLFVPRAEPFDESPIGIDPAASISAPPTEAACFIMAVASRETPVR
jgi:hypothetical protein